MFDKLEKGGFGRGTPLSNTVRLRSKGASNRSISIAIGADVLASAGLKRGDSVDVFIGSGDDAGKFAFRIGFGPDAYKITSNGDSKTSGCLNLPATNLGLLGVTGTHDLPFDVRGGQIIVSLAKVSPSRPAATAPLNLGAAA